MIASIKEKISGKLLFRKYKLFTSVCIESFGICNRKCKFCPNHDDYPDRKKGILDLEVWKSVMDQLGEMNYTGRISPHLYGEPLLDKRLPDLIKYAKKQCPESEFVVMSNGDMLTEELLRTLIDAGMAFILVTNYDDVEKEDLNSLAEEYPQNIKIRDFAKDVHIRNRGGVLKEVETLGEYNLPCYRPLSQLVINWEGNVILCCMDFYGKHTFGNVKESSILDIWNSKNHKECQKILSEPGGRSHFEICKDCNNV